jgi:hypothetical protein
MDHLTAYTAMGIMAVLTISILVLVADGWDGWR